MNEETVQAVILAGHLHATLQGGVEGKPGASTYEIAVKNGYNGTEADYVKELLSNVNIYTVRTEFPDAGKVGALYCAIDENALYRWDDAQKNYACVARDYTAIDTLDCGGA